MLSSRIVCLAILTAALIALCAWGAPGASAKDAITVNASDINPMPGATVSNVNAAAPAKPVDNPAQQPTDDKEKSKRRLVLLPAFNDYLPSNSKTTARFGSSWPSVGLSVAWRDNNTDPRKIELRLDGMARSVDKASAYIFPIGIGISQRLASSKDFSAYAGVSGNLYFGKVKSIPDSVDTGWKVTGGPGAFVGANIGSRFNIQASYYGVPSIGGFGLSGLNVSAHFMLF